MAVAVFLAASCGEDPVDEPGETDVGAVQGDATADDVGPADAGASDAGPVDAGPVDAGPVDARAADVAPECTKDSQCPKVGQCGLGVCAAGVCTSTPAVGLCGSAKQACRFYLCDPKTGGCELAVHVDKVACDDGDPCTDKGWCEKGACQAGALKNCDDNNPCTIDKCQAAGGKATCVHNNAPKGVACSTGEICHKDDHCDGGVCKVGEDVCDCKVDADCSGKGDGDKCKGELYCATTKQGTRICVPNPATKVKCSGASNTTCATEACNPKSGKCELVPALDGKPCEDGKPETSGDACVKGLCQSGAVTKCTSHAWCEAKHGDGNLCNGTMYCHKSTGQCRLNPATVVSCKTVNNTACRGAVCQPKTGTCKDEDRPDGTVCFDGNACTKGDACQKGVCKAGTNVCPCTATKDCKPWEDGNLCNGTLFCDTSNPGQHVCSLNPATVIGCKTVDDSECIKTTCQPKTGTCATLQVPDRSFCEDGDKCSGDDVCKGGACLPGAKLLCECQSDADCGLFEDGDLCNGTLFCLKGKNKCALNPKTVVTCSKVGDTACTKNTCAPKTGKCAPKHRPDGADCDDGKACTTVAACKSGVCSATASKPCDDANACTKDVCDPAKGCVFTAANGAACDDGDACTKSSVCKNKGCISSAAGCDDGNGCTKDECDPKTGCKHTKLSGKVACDDGDGCTVLDSCASGTCAGKKRLWTVAEGTAGDDAGVAPVALDDGGAIVAGYVPTTINSIQGWLGRLDPAGTVTWSKEIGGSGFDQLHDVARDGAKHVVVTGLGDGSNTAGAVFVARYSLDGDQSWNAKFGSSKREWGRSITTMPYGYAVGALRYETSSNRDALVVALDSNHKQRWIRALGGAHTEDCGGIAPMTGGRLAVMAMTTELGGWLKPKLFVLDARGVPVWSRTWHLKESSEPNALIALSNGDLLAAVYGKKGTEFRSYLWRLSTNGATRWEMVLDKKGHKRRILDLAEMPGGHIAFAGNSHDVSGGTNSAWLGIVSPAGYLAHEQVIGKSGGSLVATGVAATKTGGVIWTGEGSKQSFSSKGGADIIVGTLDRGLGDTCTKSNPCAAPAKACDDGNDCTVDLCLPGKGCIHNAHNGRCDDGDPCTGHGRCKVGQCVKGQALHIDVTNPGKTSLIHDAVHLDGGGWIAVGERKDPGMEKRLWVGRFDEQGKLLKTQIWGDGKSFEAISRHIARWDADTVLVTVTQNRAKAGSDSATVIAFNRDLQSSMTANFDDNHDDHFRDVVARPNGHFYVAGATKSGTNGQRWQGLVAQFSNSGKLLAKSNIGASEDESYYAIAASPDGSYGVAGSTQHNAPTDLQGIIVRVGSDTKVITQATYGGHGNEAFLAMAPLANGGFVAGGHTPNKGQDHSWLLSVDKNLKKRWQWVGGTWLWSSVLDLEVLTDGTIITAQNVRKQSMTNPPLPAVYRVDRYGNLVGGGRVPAATSKTVTPLALGIAAVEDHILVVGRSGPKLTSTGWMLRTDGWSEGTCTGKCAGYALTACDDGKPCTADTCKGDAKTASCTHTTLKDGASCGSGHSCAAAVCK